MSKVHVAMARRSTPDALRAFAEKEASGVFTSELARCQDEWRGGLASVKHRLAELEKTCDAMLSAAPAAPTNAVSELIDRIVAAATADADAMAQKIEAQAQARAAEAHALADRLQTEVKTGQELLWSTREQLQQEHEGRAGRARAGSLGFRNTIAQAECRAPSKHRADRGAQAAARSRPGRACETDDSPRGGAERRATGSVDV